MIKNCVDSVSQQDFDSFEHIFIDNQSTDGTLNILLSAQEEQSHIRVISELDSGIYDAMNKGIKLASGEWIYFLGADDTLSPSILSKLFSIPDVISASYIYGKVVFKNSGHEFGGYYDLVRLSQINICHQAIFARKELFNIVGNFNTKYSSYADYDWNLRVFAQSNIMPLYVDEVIAEYNEAGYSFLNPDLLFQKDKIDILFQLFHKRIDHKLFYTLLDDSIFDFIKRKEVLNSITHIVSASFYTKRYSYYFMNSLYWTKELFLAKKAG